MTLKELENIIALRGEIAQLNKSMEKHYKKGDFVGDYGYAPNSGSPYTIQGIAVKDAPTLEQLKEKCKKRVAELEAQVEAAEKFIDDIHDTNVRVLVRERILNNKSWNEAAKSLYKNMSGNSALQCVKRYFSAS